MNTISQPHYDAERSIENAMAAYNADRLKDVYPQIDGAPYCPTKECGSEHSDVLQKEKIFLTRAMLLLGSPVTAEDLLTSPELDSALAVAIANERDNLLKKADTNLKAQGIMPEMAEKDGVTSE
jgi:hypothetical protein